ncbi:protein containing DUF424 [mine drainage metagenome]|uniref:Protein containing DUF424 n=1 Tax=mine drainage metagenome TaxID=410659 RepID=T1CBL4_9ZZZZ
MATGSGGFVMRVHRVRAETVVAVCDADLVGRQLPVGDRGRTVTVSAQFYGDRPVGREEVEWALQRATIVNLLGERTLALALEMGLVAAGGTGRLGGVPHAEIFTVLG